MWMWLLIATIICSSVVSKRANVYDKHDHNNVNSCFNNIESCLRNMPHKIADTLRNKHLVMIGDSLTRYQYISIVYTLRHQHTVSRNMTPNILKERDGVFSTWNDYFKQSSGLLAPFEVCDCYRPLNFLANKDDPQFENRYYHDPILNISVTFMCYVFFLAGHLAPHEVNNVNITKSYPMVEPNNTYWYMNADRIFSEYIQYLPMKPSIVVMNAGMWPNILNDTDFVHAVVTDAFKVVDLFIWRTTLHDRAHAGIERRPEVFEYTDSLFRAHKRVVVMNTSWSYRARSSDFYDHVHLMEPMYSVLNHQLMNIIREKTT